MVLKLERLTVGNVGNFSGAESDLIGTKGQGKIWALQLIHLGKASRVLASQQIQVINIAKLFAPA